MSVLDDLGLDGRASSHPDQLSGGERQRVDGRIVGQALPEPGPDSLLGQAR
jgi:ABC-type ATPase involved in cell division